MTTYRTATTPSDAMLVLTNRDIAPVTFSVSRDMSIAPEEAKIVRLPRRDIPFKLS